MRVIIVGCGRVGAGLAESLARAGNDVTILDISSEAFRRLEADFPGQAVRGDGTDEDVLRRAGADGADAFFAVTEGDNRNILTAQLAAESLKIPQVVAKINDPVRAQAYRDLGLATICRTTMMVDALARFLGLPGEQGVAAVSTATGHHPGGEHHAEPPGAEPTAARRERGSVSAPVGASTVRQDTTGHGSGATNGHVTADDTAAAGSDAEPRDRRPWRLLRRSGERGGED